MSGALERTTIYIVAFGECILPKQVAIGWTRCLVHEYIPAPRRCFKCNRYGHGIKTCRQEESTCVICGEQEHGSHCDRMPKCSNCSEAHVASSKEFFCFKLKQETLAIQTRVKCSYSDAKWQATDRLVQPKGSYAKVVLQSLPTNGENAHLDLKLNEATPANSSEIVTQPK